MLHVALVWHMHQPDYRDPRQPGRAHLPWVRLHGVKDYLDMAALSRDFPSVHQTFNLTPCLLDQIEAYAAGRLVDRHQELALIPPGKWTKAERGEIVQRFFDFSRDRMLDPFPRLGELAELQARLRREGLDWQAIGARFRDQDLIDLTVLFHLAWTDPRWRDEDRTLDVLTQKGRDYKAEDRETLLARHRALLAEILPTYREAQESGRLELTTSPYFHPILPLLCNTDSAARAMPEAPLPTPPFAFPQDGLNQVARAQDSHRRRFGKAPAGIWPSEQAVSPEALDQLAESGVKWTISDEDVLGRTLDLVWTRDADGVPEEAARLYAAYQWRDGPAVLFRDRVLSDHIGFTYTRWGALAAARDLYGRLKAIAGRLRAWQGALPPLVTIALDGENCWEFYPEDGRAFLRAFFALVAADPALRFVTPSEHLAQAAVSERLETIHSGSWIRADYATWIGDPAKNRAWEVLLAARNKVAEADSPSAEALAHLAVAEGSDWFWWYGEGHSSPQDPIFDQLYRERLQAVYEALDLPVPDRLRQSLDELPPVAEDLGELGWRWSRAANLGVAKGTMGRSDRSVGRLSWGATAEGFWGLNWQPKGETLPSPGDRLDVFLGRHDREGGCEEPGIPWRAHYRLTCALERGVCVVEESKGSAWSVLAEVAGRPVASGWAWLLADLPATDFRAVVRVSRRDEAEARSDSLRLAWVVS